MAISGLLLLNMTVLSCVGDPYTGRSRLIFLSESTEIEAGERVFREFVQDPKIVISADPREVEPVQRVAKRIIEAAKVSKYADLANRLNWEVIVIKDDTNANAFSVPGGKIVVYTGVFLIAQNQAGLAAVIGTVTASMLLRHGAERISKGVLAPLSRSNNMETRTDPELASVQTSEAVRVGLLLMAEAGYDPRQFSRLRQELGHFSSIPSEKFDTWMNDAVSRYRPRFENSLTDLPMGPVPNTW